MSELSIIALGSGRPNGKVGPLLSRAVELTGKESAPHVLVIPTSKYTIETHLAATENARDLYERRLKLPFAVLHDFGAMPSPVELDEKLGWADIVYMTGGDTTQMMEVWKVHGIDKRLASQAFNGLVLTGISAGAIAPFVWGHSDPNRTKLGESGKPYAKVNGIGIVNAAISPHFNTELDGIRKKDSFEEFLTANQQIYGLGLDNMAGIEVNGNTITVLSAKKSAGVTILVNHDGLVEAERFGANEKIDASELIK